MDVYSKPTRSYVMSRIRKVNTRPEIVVRLFLFQLGFRYRLHRKDLPGTPDIVLSKYKIVIFVHGCFWHQHSCKLGKLPKTNTGYWFPKLHRNKMRDKRHSKKLKELGWRVITIWECETLKNQFDRQIRQLMEYCD